MSFNFSVATTTSASTFGTTTPSTGFTFGSGDASKPSMFGGSTTENKPAFNFTKPQGNAAPTFGGGSFAFGSPKTTAAAAPSLFSTPTPAGTTSAGSAFGASKPLSFGFTSPPNQTVGSPGFGQPQNQNAAQNLSSFGASTQPQQQQAAPPAFTPATQVPAFGTPGTGFGLSKPTTSTPTGFGFATPTSGFSAPQQNTATSSTQEQSALSGSAFAKPAFGATPGFGTTAAPQTSTTTFGQPPTNTSQPAQPTGLSFGAGNTATTGLSFAQTPAPAFGTATSQPQTQGFGAPASNAPAASTAFGTTTPAPQPTQPSLSFGTTTTSSPAPTGLSFGTTPTAGFATAAPATAAGAAPLSFGVASTAATSSQTAPSFGVTSAPSSGLPAASTATSKPGFGFGAATTASGLSFGTTTTAATTSAPLGLSGFGATSAPSSLPMFSGPGASKPPTLPSFSSAPTSSAASTTAPSGITALGKSTAASAPSTMASLTTATTTVAAAPAIPQAISSITFAQLEENINKWTLELEEQERTFINQATQINAWDRLLIANGEKIVELNDAVQTVKNEQQSLEHELDFVLAQQKELEDLLSPLEKQLLDETADRLRDPEREHMYTLAENLDTQLRQMSEDLKEVIEHLNETNRSQDSNDPIVQIGRILNAHMSSMQWIDNSIAQISTKLDQLKTTHDTLRRENERSFQLTYN